MSRYAWSLALLALIALIPRAYAEIGCGDINADSKVNVSDATLELRIAVGILQATDEQKRVGDLNKDGRLNVSDATLLLRSAVGLIKLDGLCAPPVSIGPNVKTVVGDPNPMANGDINSARFQLPTSVTLDSQGNLYVADLNNHAIRMIDTKGQVSTLVGNGVAGFKDGPVGQAQIGDVRYVAVGPDGAIYFSDASNERIRKISPDHSTVSTLAGNPDLDDKGFAIPDHADGPGNQAKFYYPWGLALDKSGNLFVADADDNTIRKITPDGTVSTFAGTGQADFSDGSGDPLQASFWEPVGLAFNANGDLFISDWGNELIREVSASGEMSTFAGNPLVDSNNIPQPGFEDGSGDQAQFGSPWGIKFGGDTLYVADADNYAPENTDISFINSRVRAVTPSGDVTTVAGSGRFGMDNGNGEAATFRFNQDVAPLPDGTIYVADTYNNAIRKIASDGTVSTLAGVSPAGYQDGPADKALLTVPQFIAGDGNGNFYIADTGNNRIRKLSADGTVSTVIGQDFDENGQGDYQDGPVKAAKVFGPTSVAVAKDGSIFFSDRENHVIRKISTDGIVTTFAGTGQPGYVDGPGSQAQFNRPRFIEFGPDGYLYVADTINNRIRKIAPDGTVSTVAGSGTAPGYKDGPANQAVFGYPQALAVADDGTIYVSDFNNQMIRKIDPKGNVTTFAGNPPLDSDDNPLGGYQDGPGNEAQFDTPGGLLLLPDGNLLVADRFNNRIRKIAPDGTVSTVAGIYDSGFWDGPTATARLDDPLGLALDKDGSVLICEEGNHRVRRLTLQ
jgi:sugar lactone lactonase YvrE